MECAELPTVFCFQHVCERAYHGMGISSFCASLPQGVDVLACTLESLAARLARQG